MGEIAEKFYHRAGGVTTGMKLYDTLTEVGDDYLTIHIDGADTYLPLGPSSDPRASSFHFRKGGVEVYALTTGSVALPSGSIFIFDTTCPSGWTRENAFDAGCLMGSSTYNSAHGDGVHGHSITIPAGTSGSYSPGVTQVRVGSEVEEFAYKYPDMSSAHTHSLPETTISGASQETAPSWFAVVFCRKD